MEDLLSEIDKLNLSNYTEESVKVLQEKVAQAKEVLTNAKTQKEIDSSYNALVAYKNSGLKRVPKPEENNTPKPDTTNGKETLGKKAENTEPNGTNIAGHNHSMNRASLPEGSGFRAAPAGDVTFSQLDGSLETVAGQAPYARFTLKFRKGRNYNPQPTTATTTGVYLDYQSGSQRTEGDFINRTYVTRGSNAEVGTYDVPVRVANSSTGEVYIQTTIKVTVKPLPPTVTVTDLEHSEGKRATVTATARNSNDSTVEFYLNGVKQKSVKAVNGSATWTPNSPFNVGDRITAVNIARDKESMTGTYGGVVNIATTTSNSSNPVTIPKAPTPVIDKSELQDLVNDAERLKTTAAYYNAPKTNRDAYDTAISNGKTALNKSDVQQDELNTKRDAIKEAKKGLTGAETNKKALEDATTTEDTTVKGTAQYYNATAEKQNTYNEEVKAGKELLKKANLTQEEVTQAVGKITTAKNALNGVETNKKTLEDATTTEDEALKKTAQYYNATAEKQKTYNDAVAEGKKVLEKAAPTQTEVTNAVTAITSAKNALGGVATNKKALEDATTTDATATKSSGLYYNATEKAKKGYDEALVLGEKVLNKVDATQVEVDSALEVVNKAKDKLDGAPFPTDLEKAKAIKEVEAARTTKDQAIDGNTDLTTEEKTEVKKQTAKAKEDAVNAINAATTNAQVASEKDAGIMAINGVALPAEPEKAKAIAEIKVALEAKEKATDEDKSLTKGQKTSIKEIAKKEAMAATVKIKSATTNKEVEEAKNEGIEKIKAAYAKNAELAAELTLPKLIITKWEDEEGNELRPADAKAPAEPGGANEALAHGEIAGYEFVATRDAGEVVTHIFRKLPKKSPIVEERQLPEVENVNTKTVLPNTGANTTNTGLAGLGLSVLGAVLMTARQRRKNK